MELLRVEHRDFTLQVDCDKFREIWNKAVANVHEPNLYSKYDWSEGVESVCINDISIAEGTESQAVFFDNADYPLWVEFKTNVREASFNSANRKVAESFKFHQKKQILSGFLNYGNEIGRSEIVINYTLVNGEREKFRFAFDVLSTKLNYHEHWREIISDIEREYRMLSIDFLKKTFHSFEISETSSETHDLIWWQIFKSMREDFVESCKAILDRPRHRLKDRELYQRADKIKRFTPLLENEYARFKKDPGHLYRTEVPAVNNDTYENRFLKYAVAAISAQHTALGHKILANADLSDNRRKEIIEDIEELDALNYHSFFRNVGPFKGLTHESLILQQDTYYSNVYRTWLILQQSYSLNEGMHSLETKDIATLYEIWCYIQMKEIVRKQLGDGVEIDNSSRIELNGMFRYELGKGDRSRILFKKGDVELAELIYNPVQGKSDNKEINIDNLISRTVPQKPDIVLRLTKTEHDNMKLTYLFDAKYRIDGKDKNAVDVPPEDAINQMHRYRDAIYYTEHEGSGLKKEVIGGYILFPGNGEPSKVQVARFYESIDEVNIGAFPLRPKDEENRKLLDKFISKLLKTRANALLTQSNVIPQKGLRYEHDEDIMGRDEYCIVCYTSESLMKEVFVSGMYYTRTGDKPGALLFDLKAATARRILLIPFKGESEGFLFEVEGDGPNIYTGSQLKDKGFEHIKEENANTPYLAYQINRVPVSFKQESLIMDSVALRAAKASKAPFIKHLSEIVTPKLVKQSEETFSHDSKEK